MYVCHHVKYPLVLSDVKETWIFSMEFRKILKNQISWKSIQWELSFSIRTENGEMADTKLIVALGNFANVPENNFVFIA